MLVLIKQQNNLQLYSHLFEESPAWYFHLLAMIQACTHHAATISK